MLKDRKARREMVGSNNESGTRTTFKILYCLQLLKLIFRLQIVHAK